MNYLVLFLFGCVSLAVVIILVFLTSIQKEAKGLKKAMFYFKYFLIGKFHCKTKPRTFYVFLHKLFWFVILLSQVTTIAFFLQGGNL